MVPLGQSMHWIDGPVLRLPAAAKLVVTMKATTLLPLPIIFDDLHRPSKNPGAVPKYCLRWPGLNRQALLPGPPSVPGLHHWVVVGGCGATDCRMGCEANIAAIAQAGSPS